MSYPHGVTTGNELIAAALTHAPMSEHVLRYACYMGDCENPDHEAAGECPSVPVTVCAACYSLAQAINDEIIPDEVLAANCPVCVAAALHLAATAVQDPDMDAAP